MARLIWTLESRWWLKEIYDYIRRDSREAAHRVVRGIFDKAHMLLDFPEIGHRLQPQPPKRSVRILLYGHYRIVYELRDDGNIYILGVFHGALDLRRHLGLK